MNTRSRVWLASLAGALAAGVDAAPAEDGVAVIVGNRNYTDERVPDVTYAHRDAEAFTRYVIDVLGFDEANVIVLRDATQAAMQTAFGNERDHKGKLWSYLNPEGSDIVVYYSGHGVPGLRDRRGYLLPVNADPATAHLNGYPIDLLYDNLAKLTAASSVRVFLDACFSGDSQGGMLIEDASPVFVTAELPGAAEKAMAVLTASSGTEVASWDRQAKHGAFTHHLLDALYGGGDADADGAVTAREAKAYLDRHLTRSVRRTYLRDQRAGMQGDPSMVLAFAPGGGFPSRPLALDGDRRSAGDRFRDCPDCPEMVVVPAGSFRMGCLSEDEECAADEKPAHDVTIGRPFGLSAHEVTRREYRSFVEATGHDTGLSCWTDEDGNWEDRAGSGWLRPGYAQGDDHPAVCVSWDDAQSYVSWLSGTTGEAYRLPSEAEWEYGARARTTTAYHFGNDESALCRYANHADSSTDYDWRNTSCSDGFGKTTAPVGSFAPNRFGLHDMHGNVYEWVEDCWNGSYAGAPNDGSAWLTGDCGERVLRGGSWLSGPGVLRAANRFRDTSGFRDDGDGFRVARTLAP